MTTMPLLSVEGLRLSGRDATIVENLSFDIGRGEFLGVVGESGSGKTMAARAVIGLLPEGVRRISGRILLNGEDLCLASPRRLRALRGSAIGMVFQEPMVSLNPSMTIGAQLAEAITTHERPTSLELRRRILDMLERVRIAEPERALAAWPHEFSGGMRQRIMLASAMLLGPKLLIADEPTTALDTLNQQEVLDLMVELARDDGAAVMLITHNLGLVGRYAERAIVMRRGELVETGKARDLLLAPKRAYTQALVDALPRRGARRTAPPAERPAIEALNVSVLYPGRGGLLSRKTERRVVDGVTLAVRSGEIVAVVGGSGSGKTTLGRALLGLTPIASGEIIVQGVSLGEADRAMRRKAQLACQFVFQDPHSSLDPRMRVSAAVGEPLRQASGLSRAERARRVAEALDQVGLAGFGERFPHALSGGQRQRVAIARAIIARPAFVVADEPVSALDATVQRQVIDLFRSLQRLHGFACLFISHDLGVVDELADRVIVMEAGRIVEEGPTDEVFDRPQHRYTRALLAASATLDLPSASSTRADLVPQGSGNEAPAA
jgi:peptide/nickel transport system ATP-binding protein